MNDFNNYLQHHGILGMKWGVRRYRNEDGSLTPAGKKRYSSGKRTYLALKKQVRDARAKKHGPWWNRAPGLDYIGPNSERVSKEAYAKSKKFRESKEYTNWAKKRDRALAKNTEDYDNERIDYDEMARREKEILNSGPKPDFHDPVWRYSSEGFADDFVNRYGKDISIAYLKDLGYNDETAKTLVNMMARDNYTLGAFV